MSASVQTPSFERTTDGRAVLEAQLPGLELARDNSAPASSAIIARSARKATSLSLSMAVKPARDGFDAAAVAHPFEDERLDLHGLAAARVAASERSTCGRIISRSIGPCDSRHASEARRRQNREDEEGEDLDDQKLGRNPQSACPRARAGRRGR